MNSSNPFSSPSMEAENLRSALQFFLEDDNMIDRFEADGLKTLIMQDGKLSATERQFLEEAMERNNFDQEAIAILKNLLQRHSLITDINLDSDQQS